ncbi:metallophosphatase [Bacteroidia bacterium]|nr:metallophosphatase [Bacteroidia bacterium]GHT27609.1 metallophosphatase [Bacteroidia bacterium]GHT85460.1 metallophosphatase [Bacteroidia bacterium]
MNLFFIIAFLIYTLINVYVFYRGWQALPKSKRVKWIYAIVYLFIFLSFIIAMLGRNHLPVFIQKILYFPGTSWLAVMMYLLLFFILTDLIYFLYRIFHGISYKDKKKFRKMQVFTGYSLVIALAIYGYVQFSHPKIVEQEIVIHKNSGNYKELKVVGISDLHLGINIDKKRLAKQVKLINEQHPDLIVIAGDIVDNNVLPLEKEKMWEEFEQLQAPLGVYFCPGNHEYLSGIKPSMAFLKKTKLHLLIDNYALVDNSLYIIGRDDKQGNPQRKSLKDLLTNINPALPMVLLDHEPYHLEEAEANGIDLQFSGHTHNGQIWPGNLVVKWIYELGHGYKQRGNTHYFVSSGLGLWGPQFRIGTESEVVVFNIKFN